MTSEITTPRAERARELDIQVENSLPAWAEIQRTELWRELGFNSFKAYCESKGKSYQSIWGLIKLERIQQSLPDVPITDLEVANAIGHVAVPARRQVIEAIKESGQKVTPESVKQAASIIAPKRSKALSKDYTGIEIPPELQMFWNRNSEINEIVRKLNEIIRTVERAEQTGDALYRFMDFKGTASTLKMCKEEFALAAKSYAVCPTCNGVFYKDCVNCKGRGTMPKFFYQHSVPEEIKAIREATNKIQPGEETQGQGEV